jgi:hypothetical protein
MRYAKNVALKSQVFQSQLAYYEQGSNVDYLPIRELPRELPIEQDQELETPSYYVYKSPELGTEENI